MYKKTAKELLNFSIPILLGQVGVMLIGAGDVAIAGRYNQEVLAGLGVANGLVSVLSITAHGPLIGLSPFLSKRNQESSASFGQLKSVLLFTLALIFILISVHFGLYLLTPYLPFNKQLIPSIMDYMSIIWISYPGMLLFAAMKEYLQTYEKAWTANLIGVAAVILNIPLNLVLVFGHGPFPEMGIKGTAWASVLIRIFMALALFVYARLHEKERQKDLDESSKTIRFPYKELTLFSIPVTFTFLVEVSAFASTSAIMGTLKDISQSAAHNVVLTLASITFMGPLAISSALGTKVGKSVGLKDREKAKEYILIGTSMSLALMTVSAALFLLLPEFFLGPFTKDSQTIKVSMGLLVIVGLFQIFDGLQISLAGVLRGLGRPSYPFYVFLVGLWMIGMPLGLTLTFKYDMQAMGIWIGLACGLFVCSIGLIPLALKSFKEIQWKN